MLLLFLPSGAAKRSVNLKIFTPEPPPEHPGYGAYDWFRGGSAGSAAAAAATSRMGLAIQARKKRVYISPSSTGRRRYLAAQRRRAVSPDADCLFTAFGAGFRLRGGAVTVALLRRRVAAYVAQHWDDAVPWMPGWTFGRAALASAGLAQNAGVEHYKIAIEATAPGTCVEASILAELYGVTLILIDALDGTEVLSHEPTALRDQPSSSTGAPPLPAQELVLLHTKPEYAGESTGSPAHYELLQAIKPWSSVVPPDNFRLLMAAPPVGTVTPRIHAGTFYYFYVIQVSNCCYNLKT